MINLYFRHPCDEWAMRTADEIAIAEDISIESAVLRMLERLISNLSRRDNSESYLDGMFGDFFGRHVYAPRMTVGQYKLGKSIYPMIYVSSSHVIHKLTGDYWPITEKAINHFGKGIEDAFGLEFVEYRWAGPQKWLSSTQVLLNLS